MSLKGPIRRLEADMLWLRTEGTFRHIRAMLKVAEMRRELTLRHPALAEKWGLWSPEIPRPGATLAHAPTPVLTLREALLQDAPPGEVKQTEPLPPHPEEQSEGPRLEGCEPAPPVLPTLRDAAPGAAPQDEVKPDRYDIPEHMQIRPITWRQRGPQDRDDDAEDMVSRCLTEYDPLEDA